MTIVLASQVYFTANTFELADTVVIHVFVRKPVTITALPEYIPSAYWYLVTQP